MYAHSDLHALFLANVGLFDFSKPPGEVSWRFWRELFGNDKVHLTENENGSVIKFQGVRRLEDCVKWTRCQIEFNYQRDTLRCDDNINNINFYIAEIHLQDGLLQFKIVSID